MEVCPTAISSGVDILEVSRCHLLQQMSSHWGSQKLLQGLFVSWTDGLPFYFKPILTEWIKTIVSKGCKPDNFESHNFLKLCFMNIWGLYLNFVDC